MSPGAKTANAFTCKGCLLAIIDSFEPLIIRTQVQHLSHLRPFVFQAMSNKVARPIRIGVRFTNHCFTEGFDETKHQAREIIVKEGPRYRVFSPARHACSFRLPALVRGLADDRIRVFQTSARRNWMYAAILDPPDGAARYQIFFMLRRSAPDRRAGQDLDLVVESAYLADPEQAKPNVLGRIGFALLAGQVFLGNPVSTRT